MTQHAPAPVSVLGLGAMGRALADAFLRAGHPTTVWNRTPGKDTELVAAGARGASSVGDALAAGGITVLCLLEHNSVHDVLDPVADQLRGHTVVNLTSTTAEEARELAAWAEKQGVHYLDGGIMATPDMVGTAPASFLYSGTQAVFDDHCTTLEVLGTSEYLGEDPGTASQVDFALLAGMYVMFAGFHHGAAMVRTAGIPASEFAQRAKPWLTAMTAAFDYHAQFLDSGDYTTDVQSLDFNRSALDAIARTSRESGVSVDVVAPVKALIDSQIVEGHGAESFSRIFEGIKAD
ncbi:NAD(P)-dependent oxidoreductase [Nocardiopsis oceani]